MYTDLIDIYNRNSVNFKYIIMLTLMIRVRILDCYSGITDIRVGLDSALYI